MDLKMSQPSFSGWTLLLGVGLFFCSLSQGADWPQFLGPNRDGTTSEKGLIDSFPDTGPKVIWRAPAGEGMAAVAVANGVAYTTWNDGDDQALFALDARSGKQLWRTVLGKSYANAMGNGPRATPAIQEGTVFAYTGEGILCAVNASNGELLWRTNLMQLCQTTPSEYGMSSSPIVIDGQVVVHVGGNGSAVVSVDKKTGKMSWKAGNGPAGYSSPILATLHNVNQVVSITGSELYGMDVKSGNVLWSYPFETDYACNTANPVIIENSVFISSGENHGCVLLDIKKEANGFAVAERWQSTLTKSVMRNEWQTSIAVGGLLFGFDNVGAAGPVTHLSCIESATGKPVWQMTRFGKGNMVLADNKFWITTMDGELILASLDASGLKERSRSKLFESTRQTMTIANGLGYIRDKNQIVCVQLSKK